MAQHIHRLGRDLRELSQHNFDCSASNMCIQTIGISTHLSLCIKGGPYSTAHYSFRLDIPESFPFKCPSILATVPVWHPNIELRTGVVTLPIEWTPDLRLLDLALHLQLLMLNPSPLAVSNIEASIACDTTPELFLQQIQHTLDGNVVVSGVEFQKMIRICANCTGTRGQKTRCGSIESTTSTVGSSASTRKRRPEAVDSSSDSQDLFDMSRIDEELLRSSGRRRRSNGSSYKKSQQTSTLSEEAPQQQQLLRSMYDQDSSWDSYNGLSNPSQDEGDDDDSSMAYSGLRDERLTTPLDEIEYRVEQGSSGSLSYRSYTAQSTSALSLLTRLPIFKHEDVIKKQISRSLSIDEWDSGNVDGVQRTGRIRGQEIYRRSSVFAANSEPGMDEAPDYEMATI